jgi:hypothetical protein
MAENKFVPGVFAKTGKNPAFINIGIKLDDFKKYINKLKPDDRGFVNFSMGKQKSDPSKYSMWLDTWKPDATKGKGSNGAKPADDDDDQGLPF